MEENPSDWQICYVRGAVREQDTLVSNLSIKSRCFEHRGFGPETTTVAGSAPLVFVDFDVIGGVAAGGWPELRAQQGRPISPCAVQLRIAWIRAEKGS